MMHIITTIRGKYHIADIGVQALCSSPTNQNLSDVVPSTKDILASPLMCKRCLKIYGLPYGPDRS